MTDIFGCMLSGYNSAFRHYRVCSTPFSTYLLPYSYSFDGSITFSCMQERLFAFNFSVNLIVSTNF